MNASTELAPRLNHVFVDFENVHQIDASVIGSKAVSFTLLLGAKQTKLDAGLVEKLMEHAASVQLIRLASSGKNALDFTLAYYVGRAVSANPTAFIHIVSKDTGYDPLVEHLRSRHIHAHRHDSFATLTFSGTTKAETVAPKPETVAPKPETVALKPETVAPKAETVAPKAETVAPKAATVARKPGTLPKENPSQLLVEFQRDLSSPKPETLPKKDPLARVLEHLRKNDTNRPKKKETLLSHLKSTLGKDATEAEAIKLLEMLRQAGHISIGDKDAVSYHV